MDNADLLRLIYEGHERTYVEYKRSEPWSGDFRYKLVKGIMAMANAGGGYIVIGYDEEKADINDRYTGINDSDLPSWDITPVSRDVNNYCDPPLDIELPRVQETSKGLTFLVIRVPGHKSVPHICKKNQHASDGDLILTKGALYYRNRNKESAEIADTDDWRELIKRCTLAHREDLLRDIDQILRGAGQKGVIEEVGKISSFGEMNRFRERAVQYDAQDTKGLVFWEIICYPVGNYAELDAETSKIALSNACYDYRGWPFVFYSPSSENPPRFDEGIVFAFANLPFNGRVEAYYWAFDYGRVIFYSRNLTIESFAGKPQIIDPNLQTRLISEAIIAQGRLFSSLQIPLDAILEFAVRYHPAKGLTIGSLDPSALYRSQRLYAGEDLTWTFRETVSQFLYNAPGLAADATISLASKMGYDCKKMLHGLQKTASEHLTGGQKV